MRPVFAKNLRERILNYAFGVQGGYLDAWAKAWQARIHNFAGGNHYNYTLKQLDIYHNHG